MSTFKNMAHHEFLFNDNQKRNKFYQCDMSKVTYSSNFDKVIQDKDHDLYLEFL